MAVIPMTMMTYARSLRLLQAFSSVIFSYSYAAVDKISADTVRRVVPLR